jgi:uncharacterized protein (UPF0218 family)
MMTEEKLWINVKQENGEQFDRETMQEFTDEMQQFFDEKNVIVTVGDMDTISAEEAQGIAETLQETMG